MKRTIPFLLFFLAANLFCQKIPELNDLSGEEVFFKLSNWQSYTQPTETGIFQTAEITFSDTLMAPYSYYIPSSYQADQPTPLLVYLHGGVSRPQFVDIQQMESDNIFAHLAEANGWLLLIPFANQDCSWWDENGYQNIRNQIIFLKKNFNINDDQVFLTGISDGGSGSFHIAMTRPDLFSSFHPLIGMVSVGNQVNGRQTYVANLKNRFTAAYNNDEDGLYPAARMRLLMDLAQQAGADLFYREFWGFGHDVDWLEDYKIEFIGKMQNHLRDPFQPEIYWETAEPEFNRCDWLEITEIDTLPQAKEWHKTFNIQLTDDRMMFGFRHDQEYEADGTLIFNVVENSAAENAGLQVGDIIIGMDGKKAANIDSLTTWRDARKRGDEFSLTVLRDGTELVLEGRFPEPESYNAFRFSKPSGAVKARYYGNIFEIETSRVKEISLYFHPEMINPEIPVIVNINGKKVFEDLIGYNKEFMIKNYRSNLDRKALWINKLTLQIPVEM